MISRTTLHFLLLALILIVAAGVRVHNLTRSSFWEDEFYTIELTLGRGYAHIELPTDRILQPPPHLTDLRSAAPWWMSWTSEMRGTLPPLYIVLMRLWGNVTGQSDAAARGFSVVASVAAVWLLYLVCRALHGTTVALWAAAIMALAGPQIQFAQEARNYALLELFGLTAAASLLWIQRTGRSQERAFAAFAFFAALTAMMLTHYFAAGAAVALALYGMIEMRGAARRWATAAIGLSVAVFIASWGKVALSQIPTLHDPSLFTYFGESSDDHVHRTLARIAALPLRFITEPMQRSAGITLLGALIYVLPFALLRRHRDLLLWTLWLPLTVAPIAILDLSRHTRQLELIRYTLLASPAMYALLAAMVPREKKLLAHVVPGIVALACALALPHAYSAWWKADWRGVARAVAANAHPGDIIIYQARPDRPAYAALQLIAITHYAPSDNPIVLLTRDPGDRLLADLRRAPGVLLIEPHTSDGHPAHLPGAHLQWLAMEAGAARLWRVRFD